MHFELHPNGHIAETRRNTESQSGIVRCVELCQMQ